MINLSFIKNLINIDLNEFFRNKKDKDSLLVADRFVEIFKYHGISKNQIPEIFPEISLDDLANRENILAKLDEGLLKKTASLFCINKEWLTGDVKVIYKGVGCYKRPEIFLNKLRDIDLKKTFRPVLLLSLSSKLDYKSKKSQPLLLFLQEKIKTIGHKEIYRYFLFNDGWNWRNYNGRIQLKATGKFIYEKFEVDIPIYSISKENFKKLKKREAVPSAYNIPRENTGLFLENYSLTPNVENNLPPGEPAETREVEDLPMVMQYCKSFFSGKSK